jgi:hypothetical protein
MAQEIEKRQWQTAIAAGYEAGARRTDEMATGLEAAVILLEHLKDSEPGPELAARFEEAGLTSTVAELRKMALGAVSQKAAMERSIADGMDATAAQVRAAAA